MTDALTKWSAGPFVLTGLHSLHAPEVRFSGGPAGEVVAIFECVLPDLTFDAVFLRYDPARQAVDLISHLDLTDEYGLHSSEPIPDDLHWEFEVAADPGSPQPDVLFGLMNRVNTYLGLVHTATN